MSTTVKRSVILVVEDEVDLRELITSYLSSKGYETRSADGGNAALALLERESVDLIVSDIRMPQGDGITLLEAVRKSRPQIPRVILVSGFSDYSAEECRAKGAYAMLAKPFDLKEFIQTIHQALDAAI